MLVSLKAARVNANLTQKAVAKALGISEVTIINWEKGKTSPTADNLSALCALYNANIDDIFLPKRYS